MIKHVPCITTELSMLKDVLILFIADFMEVIHVELPDEGREITVSEVDGKDFLFETININDSKVSSLRVPSDDL